MEVKRYDFEHLAKRNCAHCTTTVTTTEREFYVLATDFRALASRHARAIEALRGCVSLLDEVEKGFYSHRLTLREAQHMCRETRSLAHRAVIAEEEKT